MSITNRKTGWLGSAILGNIQSSLQAKMTVWAGAILALASIILIIYSVFTLRQTSIEGAQNEALAIAESQAQLVRVQLEVPLITARTMANSLEAIKDPDHPVPMSRDQVNAMLRSVASENPSFLATYTLWEPNAFDGLDAQYKETEAHDETGRFIPYWVNRPDGSVTVEALIDYEVPVAGDWYLQPRATKKEYTIAPLIYPVAGVDTLMATFTVPILTNDKFYGIAGVDAPIAFVQGIVDNVDLYAGKAEAVILTDSGTLVAVNNNPTLTNQPATELYEDFETLQPRIAAGEVFISLSPDGNYLRIFSPIEIGEVGTRWSFSLIIPFSEVTAQATASAIQQVMISIALLAIALFILWFLTGQVVRPIRELTNVAGAISQGNLNTIVDIRTSDETGLLATAFNTMTSRLRDSIATLEQRVAERTHSLELAAEVGRTVSQVRALDIMLKDAAEIIRSQFNLYYVQVYLTDPSQTNLILQSGTGAVGAELIGRGHRLPLNTASINGRAAIEKRSIVVEDTAASATFKPNPLLPDTRSEMAVPLLIGEKVVGVLDMQSERAGSLSRDVLPGFEALAGQLAIAIQNATFLAETQQARAEVESQARRLTRANWVDYMDAIHQPEEIGFVFEQNKITPLTQEEPVKENALMASISVTGEPLGNLVVDMEGPSPIAHTSELVNTVAQQVARQIESLRLLDSAERYRFEAEQASRRLTREGWKEYMELSAGEGMGYVYDLKEVRPYNRTGDQLAEESAFSLPLKVRGETVGKFTVLDIEPDNKDAFELANAVAERLGAHIESLRQFDQTQSALAQSEKLFEAGGRLAQATDLQDLVNIVVRTINIPVINRAIMVIFNYGPNGDLDGLDVIANWWNGSGHEVTAVGTHYPFEVVKAMSLFLAPKPVFFNDVFNDERVDPTSMQLVKRLNLRAIAVLPLYSGTQQIGALLLESEEVHNFTQDETRLYIALAPQIATVLENRRQFERAQKQAERETMLNLIGQKIRSATSVDAVLQIAARELGHALGAPLTIAQLSMKDRK